MARTTRYAVRRPVRHDKLYTEGEIELTAEEAEPLLALGSIAEIDGENAVIQEAAKEAPSLRSQFVDLVGARAYRSLEAARRTSPHALHLSTDEELEALDHIAAGTLRKIRAFLAEHGEALGLAELDALAESRAKVETDGAASETGSD